MRAPRETDLLRACLTWLHLHGVYCWRQNQGAVSATSATGRQRFVRFTSGTGLSDIVGLLRPTGRLLAVAVKQPGRKPTKAQDAFLATIAASGGLALCVHSLYELQAALPFDTLQPMPAGTDPGPEATTAAWIFGPNLVAGGRPVAESKPSGPAHQPRVRRSAPSSRSVLDRAPSARSGVPPASLRS